jgi:hypothetical protein
MKRWAVVTVALYVIAVLLLLMPVFKIAFAGWASNPQEIGVLLHEYSLWGAWIWFGVLAGGQALFLLVPIHIAERRLPARRPVKIPAIVTGFFLANLLFAGIISIGCAFLKDDALKNDFMTDFPNVVLIGSALSWLLWTIIFMRFAKSEKPEAFLNRSVRWLLRGSILELLVAIPSHIVVRRRDDCCAPIGTFWGIATGISVMLFCFGPGVYFLFVERFRRLQPKERKLP